MASMRLDSALARCRGRLQRRSLSASVSHFFFAPVSAWGLHPVSHWGHAPHAATRLHLPGTRASNGCRDPSDPLFHDARRRRATGGGQLLVSRTMSGGGQEGAGSGRGGPDLGVPGAGKGAGEGAAARVGQNWNSRGVLMFLETATLRQELAIPHVAVPSIKLVHAWLRVATCQAGWLSLRTGLPRHAFLGHSTKSCLSAASFWTWGECFQAHRATEECMPPRHSLWQPVDASQGHNSCCRTAAGGCLLSHPEQLLPPSCRKEMQWCFPSLTACPCFGPCVLQMAGLGRCEELGL